MNRKKAKEEMLCSRYYHSVRDDYNTYIIASEASSVTNCANLRFLVYQGVR